MKATAYRGKVFMPEKIPEKLLDDVSEDFKCPCWRVTIPDADYEPTERCFYYADVFVGEDMRVLRIERNKDIFLTNYLIASFPRPLEAVFGELLTGALADNA